jgi:Tfp pilus assembly protein PilV
MVNIRLRSKAIPHKRGIAMIELIFSLVIMGIVLLSAPMLIQQSIKSGNVALQQEAIAAAASQTSVILSMYWDENNNSNTALPPMFNTNRSPFEFNSTTPPLGLEGVEGRNYTDDTGETLQPVSITLLGRDENETIEDMNYDDVDDYDNSDFNLTVFKDENTEASIGDYIDVNIVMHTTVNYAEDRPDGATLNNKNINITIPDDYGEGDLSKISTNSPGEVTNIKFIRVNLTSDSGIKELEKNITFEAFSCNIGTTKSLGALY